MEPGLQGCTMTFPWVPGVGEGEGEGGRERGQQMAMGSTPPTELPVSCHFPTIGVLLSLAEERQAKGQPPASVAPALLDKCTSPAVFLRPALSRKAGFGGALSVQEQKTLAFRRSRARNAPEREDRF